jgi:hypothetical protein
MGVCATDGWESRGLLVDRELVAWCRRYVAVVFDLL